jgi:hypothetical protein
MVGVSHTTPVRVTAGGRHSGPAQVQRSASSTRAVHGVGLLVDTPHQLLGDGVRAQVLCLHSHLLPARRPRPFNVRAAGRGRRAA